MLTANALEESRQEALAAGADDFLSKPYEEDELYSIVEKQLAIRFTRQLIRNVPASPSVAGGISAADLLGLPPETRAQLAHAALSLNPQKIADALHYLAQAHPELAQGLAEFSDPSRYQRLWQVLGILDREE
jgi:DNA-binding response OmpR family regulator